jgi:regulator of protease activity HflC (stomatin/prohibitin superfamily)
VRRVSLWDGAPVAIPTRDKTYIHVDKFARWRIEDPKTYFVRLDDERSTNPPALIPRLTDSHGIVHVRVLTTSNRKPPLRIDAF